MKILFVQPPFSNNKSIYDLTRYAPTGLPAVAAYVRERNANLEIEIYDTNIKEDYSIETIIKYILDKKPDILGMTAMTINILPALEIIDRVKGQNPNITVVVGGIHVTILPEEILSHRSVDFVVIGEGEIICDELLKNLNKPENYKDIKGLGYKENGQIKINERRELIKDINELPIPAYDLLELKKYHSPYTLRTPFASMMRSRGCPFQCIFCGVQNMFGQRFRVQTPERTIKEIEHLINRYGIREISFKDSEFTIDVKNLMDFCDLLIKNKYDLVWSANARVDRINPEMYRKMKKAGCHTVTFGVESGDQEILNILKKNVTLEQGSLAVKAAKKAGLNTNAGYMLGCPFETKETLNKTIDFACELDTDYVSFGFATPFPGTEMRELADEHGWMLGKDLTHTTYTDLTMNATNLSNEELKAVSKKAFMRFYLRPKYILKRLTKLNKHDLKNSVNGFNLLLKNYFLKKK
ncbi:B12-binding domain-containing radical SAM protein [Patescibacteria group bacterium]|nr:B12-binding domain-containing radical SAM protein [Patescibacteria group bacterium]